jgi:hypothetical protein
MIQMVALQTARAFLTELDCLCDNDFVVIGHSPLARWIPISWYEWLRQTRQDSDFAPDLANYCLSVSGRNIDTEWMLFLQQMQSHMSSVYFWFDVLGEHLSPISRNHFNDFLTAMCINVFSCKDVRSIVVGYHAPPTTVNMLYDYLSNEQLGKVVSWYNTKCCVDQTYGGSMNL